MIMAATGQPGFRASAGTKFEYGDYSTTPAYGNVFPIRKYSGLSETKVAEWDITEVGAVLDDGVTPDMDMYKAFGKRDNGTIGFTLAATDDQIDAVEEIKGVLTSFRVTLGANGRQLPFAGAITGVKRTVGEKDEVLMEITISVSGPLKFNPA
jgi:hypothetical protein